MTEMPSAPTGNEIAIKDWIARRLVAFGDDLARLFLHFGFGPGQAQLVARLLVGEIVEAGAPGGQLVREIEAAKERPPPPAMPSGGPLAFLLADVRMSAWIKDKAGGIEARIRLGALSAAQATTLGEALFRADAASGDRPVFGLDGTTLALPDLDGGVYLDAPAMGDEFAGLRPGEIRSLLLVRTDRHVGHLERDGVALIRFAAAVPVDRRLVGIVKSPPAGENREATPWPRIDRRV